MPGTCENSSECFNILTVTEVSSSAESKGGDAEGFEER